MRLGFSAVVGLTAIVGAVFVATTFTTPPLDSVQRGYRGLGQIQTYQDRAYTRLTAANQAPEVIPAVDPEGEKASVGYKNLKVLGDLDKAEFDRLMMAITNWVSPDAGCNYCHNPEDMASDEVYTKVVARRMLEMVSTINTKFKAHVANTGVTCYTCHRGQPVPSYVWFTDPNLSHASGYAQGVTGQNKAAAVVGYTSLPYDVFTPFLKEANDLRVISGTALPQRDAGARKSIMQAEWTYGVMAHISDGLGVNCTYCHNTRSFTDWSQSSPQRVVAWHAIRHVRELNNTYLDPLASILPANRLGALGDAPKVNCTTCHQGVFKPLLGVSQLKDYPELATTLTVKN
jgi:photosynthetic reaction center cytochrome c subunit